MMRDFRELLDRAAEDPPDLPDIEGILLRARPRIIRRRLAAGVIALVVGVAGWVGTASLLSHVGVDGGEVVDLAPAPTITEATAIREGLLEPGTYGGRVGAYDFLLETRNDAWSVVVAEPAWLALTYRQYVLHLQVWDGVVAPDAAEASGWQKPPADVAAWLAAHPRLSTSAPTEVVVGGIAATQLDVRAVRPLERPPDECTGRCVILGRVAGAGELVDLELGQRARFLVFGPSGQQLVAYYRAPERQFPVLDDAVQALLANLRLVPSG